MQIIFLLATAILPQISESIFSPCLPDIAASFSESMSAVEHVFTTYLVGYALGMFFWGSLSDYLGRVKTLRFGLGCYLFGVIMCYFAATLPQLLIFRFIQGLGGSACAVLVIALCRDYFAKAERAKMMAKLGMALSIGPMLGPLLGSSIMAYYPWNSVYVPLVTYAVGIFCATRYVPVVEKPSTVPNLKHYYAVLTDKTIWLYAVLIGHACGIGFSFFSEATFFFTTLLPLPQKYISICYIVVGWAWYIGGSIAQQLIKKHSIKAVMLRGVLISLVSSFLFCLTVSLITSPIMVLVASIILVFTIMVGLGLVIGNAITLALEPYDQFSGCCLFSTGVFVLYGDCFSGCWNGRAT